MNILVACQVFYVVDKPTEDWMGGKGHVSKDVLLKGLPSPSDDTLILVHYQLHFKQKTVDAE